MVRDKHFVQFEFLPSGIKAWKAYGVGEGQMFLYENLSQCMQGPTFLCIIIESLSSRRSRFTEVNRN